MRSSHHPLQIRSLTGPASRLRPILWGLLAISLLAASACRRVPSGPGILEGVNELSATLSLRGADNPPCNLLAPVEIEAAINSPVEGSQTAGRPAVAGMQVCTMVGRVDRRDITAQALLTDQGLRGPAATWGVLDENARQAFEEYRSVNERYIETATRNEREELWDPDLRTLLILGDDGRLFAVRLTVGRLPLGRADDRKNYLRETARELLDRAIKRASDDRDV